MRQNSPSTSIESRSCSDTMLLAFLRTQPETAPCQEGVWLHRTTASHQHANYADHAAASECASRHLAVAVQGSAAKGLGFQAALRHTTKAPVRFISWLQAGSPEMLDFQPQAGLLGACNSGSMDRTSKRDAGPTGLQSQTPEPRTWIPTLATSSSSC